MSWLDSTPVKYLFFTSAVCGLAGTVSGVVVGQQAWGTIAAMILGGLIGLACGAVVGFGLGEFLRRSAELVLWKKHRYPCPTCEGRGLVLSGDRDTSGYRLRGVCPVCHGHKWIMPKLD